MKPARPAQGALPFDAAGPSPDLPQGVLWLRGRLGLAEQRAVLDAVADAVAAAPFFRPVMRDGTPMVNRLTNLGPLGWVSDRQGYRYQPHHPETGAPWPAVPPGLYAQAVTAAAAAGVPGYAPDACLVNAYRDDGRLGLHRDHDEADFRWPIVSFSFGAEAAFILGGPDRRGPTRTLRLVSGDVLVLAGPARLRFHGVRRIFPGTAPFDHPLFGAGARINLTFRRAMP